MKKCRFFLLVLLIARPSQSAMPVSACYQSEVRTVRGDSLAGVVAPGSDIKILFGYYGCNPVKRDDIVAYHFAGDSVPIIKIVKGMPGDTFALLPDGDGTAILVNGKKLKTSTGQPYRLEKGRERMLSLYVKNYKGKIPRDSYLLLGNQPGGTLDSSRFGLAGNADILGKVIL